MVPRSSIRPTTYPNSTPSKPRWPWLTMGGVIARGGRAELLATLPGHAVLDFDGDVPPLDHASRAVADLHFDVGRMTVTAADPGRRAGGTARP